MSDPVSKSEIKTGKCQFNSYGFLPETRDTRMILKRYLYLFNLLSLSFDDS